MQKVVGKFFLVKGFFVDMDVYFQNMAILEAVIMQVKVCHYKSQKVIVY